MLNKKEMRLLIINGILLFLVISIFVYIFYIKSQKPKVPHSSNSQDVQEDQTVPTTMIDVGPLVKADTKITFEIKDQLGLEIETSTYPGDNLSGYTESDISNMYKDYTISKFDEEEIILTKIIEREIEPSYILTHDDDSFIILLDINDTRILYKDTKISKHHISDKLDVELVSGIPISNEQKSLILKDEDELYKILQEYDE